MEIERDRPHSPWQVQDLLPEEYTQLGLSWEMPRGLADFELKTNDRGMEFVHVNVSGEEVIQKSARKDKMLNEAAIYRKLFRETEAIFVMLARAVLEDEHRIYITLPYLPAGDVMDRLIAQKEATGEVLSRPFTQKVSRQLLEGVRYLHDRNIGHLDISLENMLLTDTDDIRIMDFDQSVELRDDAQNVRYFYTDCGKGYTKAPEVWVTVSLDAYGIPGLPQQTCYAAAPVDAWACGVAIFTMLTGTKPWEQPPHGFPWAGSTPDSWVLQLINSRDNGIVTANPEALLLLQGLLELQPQRRMSPSEALLSPWLPEAVAEAALGPSIMEIEQTHPEGPWQTPTTAARQPAVDTAPAFVVPVIPNGAEALDVEHLNEDSAWAVDETPTTAARQPAVDTAPAFVIPVIPNGAEALDVEHLTEDSAWAVDEAVFARVEEEPEWAVDEVLEIENPEEAIGRVTVKLAGRRCHLDGGTFSTNEDFWRFCDHCSQAMQGASAGELQVILDKINIIKKNPGLTPTELYLTFAWQMGLEALQSPWITDTVAEAAAVSTPSQPEVPAVLQDRRCDVGHVVPR